MVDMQPELKANVQDTEQPILIVKKEEIDGTIRVRPLERREPYQRIYLVNLVESSKEFQRDQVTGTITFSSGMAEIDIKLSEILGNVVGCWRPMFAVLPDNS